MAKRLEGSPVFLSRLRLAGFRGLHPATQERGPVHIPVEGLQRLRIQKPCRFAPTSFAHRLDNRVLSRPPTIDEELRLRVTECLPSRASGVQVRATGIAILEGDAFHEANLGGVLGPRSRSLRRTAWSTQAYTCSRAAHDR